MSDRCIISWARDGRERYSRGLRNLIDSFHANGGEADLHLFSPDIEHPRHSGVMVNTTMPKGLREHREVPYAFKVDLFEWARAKGYARALWLDAAMVVLCPLEPVWRIARERGVFAGLNPGCPQAYWTSEAALDAMGCPRDAIFEQICGFALAFDFTNPTGAVVFDEWAALSRDGVTFAGAANGPVHEGEGSNFPGYRAHRHDQSALSWVMHKHGVTAEPYGLTGYRSHAEKFPQMCVANQGIQNRWA